MNSGQTVMVVLGTRPEVVKLAPVVGALRELGVDTRVVFTSQHRELAATIASAFGLVPDHDLDLMTAGQVPSQVMARVLESIDTVYAAEQPALVMVQGDTTTAVAAALAAYHRMIPVAHVEAGLRTDSIYNPFPEEMNRRLIGRIAALHFAATQANRQALLAEAVAADTVHVTGNPVIDALRHILASPQGSRLPEVARGVLDRGRRLLLLTSHRRENFGAPQQAIFQAIGDVIRDHDDVEVVLPVHPNPAVLAAVESHLPRHERVHAVAPMPYPAFLRLLASSYMVLTDSGGLQEEAPALGKPTLILRTTTERAEIVEAGSGLLVGVERSAIVAEVSRLLNNPEHYERMAVPRFPFGEGGAAPRIADVVRNWLAAAR